MVPSEKVAEPSVLVADKHPYAERILVVDEDVDDGMVYEEMYLDLVAIPQSERLTLVDTMEVVAFLLCPMIGAGEVYYYLVGTSIIVQLCHLRAVLVEVISEVTRTDGELTTYLKLATADRSERLGAVEVIVGQLLAVCCGGAHRLQSFVWLLEDGLLVRRE